MKRIQKLLVVAVVFAAITIVQTQAEVRHQLGAGVHYWVALDDIDLHDVDEDGVCYYLSYQICPTGLLKLEFDVEMLPDGYAGATEDVYAPQGYVILGSAIYVGLGVGTYYSDGDFASEPFYALRAGLDLQVLPYIHLDINANYRFEDWNDISDVDEDISSDTVTLGGAIRLQF